MVFKKTRWVKKGQLKQKGWKKTGNKRVRKVNKSTAQYQLSKTDKVLKHKSSGDSILYFKPAKGLKTPLPDRWVTEMEFDIPFYIPATTLNSLNSSHYGCICSNSLYRPFASAIGNTNAQLINVAGGAGSGLAMTVVNPGYSINDNAYNQTILFGIYNYAIVTDAELIVDFDIQSIGDSIEAIIVPYKYQNVIPTTNTSRSMANARNSVTGIMQAYGQKQARNRLVSKFNVAELMGMEGATVNELIALTGLNHVSNVAPTKALGHTLCVTTLDAATNASNIPVRFKLIQKVVFYSPLQQIA